MKKNRVKTWGLVLGFIFLLISYSFMGELSFEDLYPIISILQNISAAIFTIIGIWIAYVYPQAMQRIVKPSLSTVFAKQDKERAQLLVGVAVTSAIILALLLIGLSVKPFLTQSMLYENYPNFFSFLGVFFILLLVGAQFFCLYGVIASNLNFIMDLINKDNAQKLDQKLNRKKGNDPSNK